MLALGDGVGRGLRAGLTSSLVSICVIFCRLTATGTGLSRCANGTPR